MDWMKANAQSNHLKAELLLMGFSFAWMRFHPELERPKGSVLWLVAFGGEPSAVSKDKNESGLFFLN